MEMIFVCYIIYEAQQNGCFFAIFIQSENILYKGYNTTVPNWLHRLKSPKNYKSSQQLPLFPYKLRSQVWYFFSFSLLSHAYQI